jgi:Alginate lyase
MLPQLRYAGMIRGVGNSGRPEGLQDMQRLPELVNAAYLLEGSPVWSASDDQRFKAWIDEYAKWVESEPVAIYARMMANYVGVNVDEQLIAAYIYLGQCASPSPPL